MSENPQSNTVWEDRLTWFKSSSEHRALDTIDGEPMEFEWNIFAGFTTLQLVREVQEFLSKKSEEPKDITGRIIFMSMFKDISWRSEDNELECELSAKLVSIYAKRFSPGRWSFLGPGSEKKWYSTHESKPQGECGRVAELMMIKFGESRHPVFRSTSPLSRGTLKSKGGGKLSIHFCADEGTIEPFFFSNWASKPPKGPWAPPKLGPFVGPLLRLSFGSALFRLLREEPVLPTPGLQVLHQV